MAMQDGIQGLDRRSNADVGRWWTMRRFAVLSSLALAAMTISWFSVYRPFTIDSFLGEKFGRVLSADVERKKLAEPIGVIDEVMLQSEGDPSRRLNCIYGYKFLGDVPEDEADRLAEEACAALEKLGKFRLKERTPQGREGFRKAVHSPLSYVVVDWDDNFFQKGKILRFEIGRDAYVPMDPDLHVDEVMGYKIGVPVEGDGKPRVPFWKFEQIVLQCDVNRIADGIYAVHDVSALGLEEATREFENARKAVEDLHGITMFKNVDYDDVKVYECYGDDVAMSVKLEYLREKQVRYAVLATGTWRRQIHSLPPVDGRTPSRVSDWGALLLCVVVLCGGTLLLLRRNRILNKMDKEVHPNENT